MTRAGSVICVDTVGPANNWPLHMDGMDMAVIETEDYYWTCGDGCCDNYGTNLYIDGVLVEDETFADSFWAVVGALKRLGHDFEFKEEAHE